MIWINLIHQTLTTMFRNFIVLAYRHFVRNPLTSFVELFGMTAALTAFILVLLWVSNEISYDEFNEHADRIFRVELVNDGNSFDSQLPPRLAPFLKENFPEIQKATRFRIFGRESYMYRLNDQNEKIYFEAGDVLHTDPEIFDIFSFELVDGNIATAFDQEQTIMIKESYAKRLFPNESAIGKKIYFGNNTWDVVTGVIKDPPNFHIRFDMIYTIDVIDTHLKNYEVTKNGLNSWNVFSFPTYILVDPQQNKGELESKMSELLTAQAPKEFHDFKEKGTGIYLRPLTDIYLNGDEAWEKGYAVHGDRKKVVAYSAISIFTLLLACINFITLNTAKTLERAKEVAIKKVSGATRVHVFIQFLGEVSLLCLLAFGLALVFVDTFLSGFNELVGVSLDMNTLFQPVNFGTMLAGLFIIALISGGFPAFFVSLFSPIHTIKGITGKKGKQFKFREFNLLAQFTLTIILLISTVTIYSQINFMKSKSLGFDKGHRLVFYFIEEWDETERVKRLLLSNPDVLSVTRSAAIPGRESTSDLNFDNLVTINGIEGIVNWPLVDIDYFKTLNVELVEGRSFDKEIQSDFENYVDNKPVHEFFAVILNETAVKTFGLENPLGAEMITKYAKFKVIGVVEDFHLHGLEREIKPTAFSLANGAGHSMVVQISNHNMRETINFIRNEINTTYNKNINIKFLDDEFDKQYQDDDHFAEIFGYLTILAILIASIGLLGVATHAIKLRIKEIGIRKTMGASSFQILNLLLGGFLKIMFFSSLLAVPIAWVAMNGWLENYAYRIDLSWWMFAAAIGLTISIALSTILWQSWQASNQNPSRLIRYE